MNKEAYIKPEMEVITLETETMIAASMKIGDTTFNTSNSDFSQRGNERRGTWGDLWDNSEE